MTGLYLQGGGAKGAFQAGVLCALNDRGIKFNVISGTSIGSINGYFVLKDAFDEMKEAWLTQNFPEASIDVDSPIIESSGALKMLNKVKGCSDSLWVEHFYVNYVPIINRKLTHEWTDLKELSEEKRFEHIRHSSLLPKAIGVHPFHDDYSLEEAVDQFKIDLEEGLYDQYVLDGGLLNNLFMEPFIDKKVSKLIMITFKTTFEIPKYILSTYKIDELCVISSNIMYNKTDTLNFSKNFIEKNFNHGYSIGSSVHL